jgi:transcription antitermination protein NusB
LTEREKDYFCSDKLRFFIMISRRLLRIKALMVLYAFNRRHDDDLPKAEKELVFSIGKTYDLYHYILLLILEIADIATGKIDMALQKKMPSKDDLNPNRRFVENGIVIQLRNNSDLLKYISENKLSWANNSDIPRAMYNSMVLWDPFIAYMTSAEKSYSSDKKFIIRLVTELLAMSETLLASFEEQSIYWNDDMEYVSAMVEKTLKKFKADASESNSLMPLYKNEEDREYVKILFRKAVLRSDECSELINRNTTNWEVERIALMDILVMKLAITEIMEFPEIPVKVTLNEYIEIAKFYCTSKSSTFVNGILDKVVKEMRDNKLFRKAGRGLVGESTMKEA